MAKILVIGENATIRRLLSEYLAGEGHVVVIVGTPALIGELLSTLEPDLVFLDFRLNRREQWRVLDGIGRQAPRLSILPYTSYGGSEEEGVSLDMISRYSEVLKQQAGSLLCEKVNVYGSQSQVCHY